MYTLNIHGHDFHVFSLLASDMKSISATVWVALKDKWIAREETRGIISGEETTGNLNKEDFKNGQRRYKNGVSFISKIDLQT